MSALAVGSGQVFYEQVYALVRRVPVGRVTTYGAIARALGTPSQAREVGWALAALQDGHDVPAHRVVNAEGALSGGWAFGSPEVQRALLVAEGVRFDERERVILDHHLWNPPQASPSGSRRTRRADPESAAEQLQHVQRLLQAAEEAYVLAHYLHREIGEMRNSAHGPDLTPVEYSLGIALGDAEISANRLGGLRNELAELERTLERLVDRT